jgi:hypothetical protein
MRSAHLNFYLTSPSGEVTKEVDDSDSDKVLEYSTPSHRIDTSLVKFELVDAILAKDPLLPLLPW